MPFITANWLIKKIPLLLSAYFFNMSYSGSEGIIQYSIHFNQIIIIGTSLSLSRERERSAVFQKSGNAVKTEV